MHKTHEVSISLGGVLVPLSTVLDLLKVPNQLSVLSQKLDALLVTINVNHKETIQMLADSTKSILAAIDTETNQLAAILDNLKKNQSNMTEAEINTALTTVSNRLKGLAADPANPVPAPAA